MPTPNREATSRQARAEVSEVRAQLATLGTLGVAELRAKYREVYDEDTRSHNKQYLVKKIAWRMQEIAEGGLSEIARRRIAELAQNAPIRRRLLFLAPPEGADATPSDAAPSEVERPRPVPPTLLPGRPRDPRLPPAGTVLRKGHHGVVHEVRILADRFEWAGKTFTSLSAVARAITHTGWNGFLFFEDALAEANRAAAVAS